MNLIRQGVIKVKKIDEQEFMKKIDIEANKRIYGILTLCSCVGPLVALGRWLNIFDVSYGFCLFITVISFIELAIDYFLCRNEKYYKIAKYFGIIAVNILIGLMASKFAVGINMSYIFAPLLSCMYLSKKYTMKMALLGYGIMMGALYFRGYDAILREYSLFTHGEWYISQGLGFTIEYAMISVALCTLSKYLKELMNKHYQISLEEICNRESNRVRNRFFNNVNQELQAPIHRIIEEGEVLLQDKSLSESMNDKVSSVVRVNKLILSKLRDLDDFSTISLEREQVEEKNYKFSQLIEQVKESTYNSIGVRNIDFNVVINPLIPNEMIGDEIKIRQVMINLLNDALMEIEDGFVILKVDYKQVKDEILLNIDIMDNNYNKDNMKKGNYYICKELCECMNGTISIINDYARGSGFTVTLPQKIMTGSIAYEEAVWKK